MGRLLSCRVTSIIDVDDLQSFQLATDTGDSRLQVGLQYFDQGWKMAPKNLGFFSKKTKSPKFRFFLFLGQILYIIIQMLNIKFHTLIFICDFCYILQKML